MFPFGVYNNEDIVFHGTVTLKLIRDQYISISKLEPKKYQDSNIDVRFQPGVDYLYSMDSIEEYF